MRLLTNILAWSVVLALLSSCAHKGSIEKSQHEGTQDLSNEAGTQVASAESKTKLDSLPQSPSESKVEPLSLAGFLDEKLPVASEKEEELKVDNSACYVCHGNYRDEGLVLVHGKQQIGCVSCHGDSFDHRNDEDNITPPDKMYAPGKVDSMCMRCHQEHIAKPTLVVKRWLEKCPEKTDTSKIVCTDCHFGHRLKKRTVRWDKKTGKPL